MRIFMSQSKNKKKLNHGQEQSILDSCSFSHAQHISKLSGIYHSYHATKCGKEVEDWVASFLLSFIPGRFGLIQNGHIVSMNEGKTEFFRSNDIDLIIYDKMVCGSNPLDAALSKNLQVIPVEAVVGIFEIKRTLNGTYLKEALSHLREIKKTIHIDKNNMKDYLIGGQELPENIASGVRSNPIFGILFLRCSLKQTNNIQKVIREELLNKNDGFLDLIYSMDGICSYPINGDGGAALLTPRDKMMKKFGEKLSTVFADVRDSRKDGLKDKDLKEAFEKIRKERKNLSDEQCLDNLKIVFLNAIRGLILDWLNKTTGRTSNYFLRTFSYLPEARK